MHWCWHGWIFLAVLLLAGGPAAATGPLRLHTSLRGDVLESLRADFQSRNPDLKLEIRSSGSGDILREIRAEREGGQPGPDVVLHSDITEFVRMQRRGELDPFPLQKPSGLPLGVEPVNGSFHVVRIAVLGLVFNQNMVGRPLTAWSDLLDPALRDRVGLPDPSLSGTGFMGLSQLQARYGWDFLERLQANGAVLIRNSSKVVDETAGGRFHACIGVDLLAFEWIRRGAPLQVVYPEPFLVAYNCVGILKGTQNRLAARRFIQYLLSWEGQALLGHYGTLPVRRDAEVPKRPGLPPPEKVLQRSVRWDLAKVCTERDAYLARMRRILQPSVK